MGEKTLLQKLIDGEIDTQAYFGEKYMNKDAFKLFPEIVNKLTTLNSQQSVLDGYEANWLELLKDCKNVVLGQFTTDELGRFINTGNVSES